jgi:DNA-binding transcriptional regulator LsrR (DeoR family)
MAGTSWTPRKSSRSAISLHAALVARRFYLDGLQKNDIADEFGVSRFKVARLLDEAKAAGIVRIYVDMPSDVDVELGERLASEYGLRHALVTRVPSESPQSADIMMASLAADYVMSSLSPDDVLGISWGTSVAQVVDEIDVLPAVDIVQMVGGVRSSALDTNGTELVRRLSHVGRGRAFPLMAPLLVDSATTATALRTEAAVSQAMNQFDRLTMALVGIGSWNPARSSLMSELTSVDREALVAAGAVADVSAVVLGASGEPVNSTVAARSLAISFEQLQAIPTVVAVAGGVDKTAAVKATLASGMVDVLVTDSVVATKILAPE